MGKGRLDTIDSECAGGWCGRRTVHSPRTYHLVPSRCQESSWSRSTGGANDGRNGQTPDCGGKAVARIADLGGEGGDASGVNR